MTARRDSADEPEAGSSGGRALLIGAVVLALAATGLLVLADEMRWMRLGIVAALWAALVGAFLAAKYRRQLSEQEDALADRQEMYELELEREVAARREYELEAVAEAKRAAEEESRDDIAALRGELQSLRSTLESLLGGEFLVERYALRAESTRMRSLTEDRQLKSLPAAQEVREAETDLIERIREVHHQPPRPQRAEPRPAAVSQPMPKPRVDQRPAAVSQPMPRVDHRSAAVSQPLPKPQQRPDRPPARTDRTDRPAPEPNKRAERVEPVAAQARRVEPPPHPAEVSDRWFIPGALDEPGQPRRQPAPQPAYNSWESEADEEWTPSWEAGQRRPEARPEPARYATPPAEVARRAHQDTEVAMRPVEPPAAKHDTSKPVGHQSEQTSWLAQYNQPKPPMTPPAERADPLEYRARPYRTHAADSGQFPVVDDLPPSGRRHARTEPEGDSGGGRRRRAEGQPTWQELQSSNGHARPDPVEEPTGSHAAGRSVNELLATHGMEPGSRRRRRRED